MGITIKGKADGVLEIAIQPLSSYVNIKNALQEKLSKNKDFFSGSEAKIIFSGKVLSNAQKQDLKRLLSMDYDVQNVAFSDDMLEQTKVSVKHTPNIDNSSHAEKRVNLVSKDYFNAKSVFVSHTLRSGQRVECEGDVVVLGDVNDGAEVIAGGSVAVMGVLRGLVHAGATGRSDVVVAANALIPKQLRISGKIGMFPDNKESGVPEIAAYKQGSIIIKPLKPQTKQIR